MKMKCVLLMFVFMMSVTSRSQTLDTVTVSLTLKSGDWAFLAGTFSSDDSSTIVQLRRLRDTIRTVNPANFNVNIRMGSLSGTLVFNIYTTLKSISSTLYDQVGTNISTQIKAISNTTLQNFITAYDNQAAIIYNNRRAKGKFLLLDN